MASANLKFQMRQNSDAIKLWTLCSRVDIDNRGKKLFIQREKE